MSFAQAPNARARREMESHQTALADRAISRDPLYQAAPTDRPYAGEAQAALSLRTSRECQMKHIHRRNRFDQDEAVQVGDVVEQPLAPAE